MKIQVLDLNSKRPIANTKVQLQIKGKDSGFLSLTTDGNGNLLLEEKYNGQQITATSANSGSNQWISASDGAKLYTSTTGTKQKSTETSQGGRTK